MGSAHAGQPREMKLPVLLLLCLLAQCSQSAWGAEAGDACLSFGVLPRQHLSLDSLHRMASLSIVSNAACAAGVSKGVWSGWQPHAARSAFAARGGVA